MKKTVSLLIVILIVLSAIPVALPITLVSAENTSISQTLTLITKEESPFTPALEKVIQMQLALGQKEIRFIIAPKDGYEWEVYKKLKDIGFVDPISKPQYKFIVVTVPRENLDKLKKIDGILKIWLDKEVKLPEPVKEEFAINPKEAQPNMFMSIYTINAVNAWQDYGVYGDNVTVAVLDTGIDPIHPFLQQTMNGKRKIIDWKDTTGEGDVDTSSTVSTVSNGYLQVEDSQVYIGNIVSANGVYHYGWLPERYFDLNQDGDTDDTYFVLVINSSQYYDTVYLDTDGDFNLTDETPLHLFSESGDVIVLPSNVGVVLADIDINGNYVSFGWDGHGHGTHVAGTIAGVGLPDDPIFAGVYGVAPNAQIMAVRVLVSWGFGYASWIIAGMIYASVYGPDGIPLSGDEADVINMSLGGWLDYNDGTENPENFYVNYLTELTGVVFSISAGNNGPALNTGGSPGNSDYAITVGAYIEGQRWELLFGVSNVSDSLAHFSSRGPRMDGRLDPDVVAPGVLIFSSLPMWYTVVYGNPYYYYGFWSGTSMAAPHVSGAVALLISYAKQHNLNYDPFKIKEALMLSAKKIEGLSMADQGFGLIQVDKAVEILQKLSDDKTVKLYIGTTFTSFKTPYGASWIPANPMNDYVSVTYDLPYLYRGVYLRNELPSTVPIYVYSLNYNGTLQVESNVDWLLPSVSEIKVNTKSNGTIFYVTIDYSKIQSPGLYEGLILIDDPTTDYLEGFVPVTVIIPKKSDNGKVVVEDSYRIKSMNVNRYFFEVSEGVQRIKVNVTTESANDLCFQLVPPQGTQVLEYIGYGCYGLRNRTIELENPVPGTWELVVYGYPTWTNKEEIYSTFEIEFYGITAEPKVVRVDADIDEAKEVSVKLTNHYAPINATVFTTDNVTRIEEILPGGYYYYQEFTEEELADVLYIEVGVIALESDSMPYLEVGYAQNSNYPVYRVSLGGVVGITMPKGPMYVYAEADKDALFYMVIVKKSESSSNLFTPVTTALENFTSGETREVLLRVHTSENGTYVGAIGLQDSESGDIVSVVPIIFQVGQPEMFVALYGTPQLGEPTLFTLKILDKATLKPIEGESKVIINGRTYYAENGELKFYYTPTALDEVLSVKVISDEYKDFEYNFGIKVSEPSAAAEKVNTPFVAKGEATIKDINVTKSTAGEVQVALTVEGETNETATVMVVVPKTAQNIKVTVNDGRLVDYYVEDGTDAKYVFITVQFASPVTVTVTYNIPHTNIIPTLNLVYYIYYNKQIKVFEELYNKSIALNVDNETLQKALEYKALAEQYYAEAGKYGPVYNNLGESRILMSLRLAVLNLRKAIEILQQAIEEAESS